jgi:hypothetical protein
MEVIVGVHDPDGTIWHLKCCPVRLSLCKFACVTAFLTNGSKAYLPKYPSKLSGHIQPPSTSIAGPRASASQYLCSNTFNFFVDLIIWLFRGRFLFRGCIHVRLISISLLFSGKLPLQMDSLSSPPYISFILVDQDVNLDLPDLLFELCNGDFLVRSVVIALFIRTCCGGMS